MFLTSSAEPSHFPCWVPMGYWCWCMWGNAQINFSCFCITPSFLSSTPFTQSPRELKRISSTTPRPWRPGTPLEPASHGSSSATLTPTTRSTTTLVRPTCPLPVRVNLTYDDIDPPEGCCCRPSPRRRLRRQWPCLPRYCWIRGERPHVFLRWGDDELAMAAWIHQGKVFTI